MAKRLCRVRFVQPLAKSPARAEAVDHFTARRDSLASLEQSGHRSLDRGEDGMGDAEPSVEAIESMEALIAPSITAVRATFAQLERMADVVRADCKAISETLDALGDALKVITQGAGVGQEWGGFGLISLPIMGTIRALKGIAGQYVKQQTGVSLDSWTDLVASSSAQFESYMSQLDTVARLAERYNTAAENEIDLQQAREDEAVLLDIRWQTQAWKQILSRVAQLGQLVDAILQANLRGESVLADEGVAERASGFSASLQERIKDVQGRTDERSGDLREWVLQPFVEVRDRVRQLPGQTVQLAHEVALLEVLLELEVAEVRACLGEISPIEARIVGVRVAASVLIPELAQQLADTKERVLAYEAYLDRLSGAREAGNVDDRAYSILSTEYRTGLESSQSHLAALQAEADVWRRDGDAVLDACAEWTKLELDVLAARRLAEQKEASGDHGALLQREQDRLNEARSALASL
jgi:hypothetical protein